MKTFTFKHGNEELKLFFRLAEYENGNTALDVKVDTELPFWEHFARLSVNFEDVRCPHGQFYLKEWSENEKVAQRVKELGLIRLVRDAKTVKSGYIEAKCYELTETGKEYVA